KHAIFGRDLGAQARRGREIIEEWRERQLRECCESLRSLYRLVWCAADMVQLNRTHNINGIDEIDQIFWDALAFAYPCISVLEHKFDRLNSRDLIQHVEAWEEEHNAETCDGARHERAAGEGC